MAIEINGLPQSQSQSTSEKGQVDVARNEPSQPKQETGGSSATDTISLTETATSLQKLQSTLADLPVVDGDRVESIRQAVASGEYEVNPEAVADKLISFEADI